MGCISIFIILSFAFLVTGNITQFVYLVKHHMLKRDKDIQYYCLWENEWGTECTKEEIEKLKQIIHQLEEKHKNKKTGNEYF